MRLYYTFRFKYNNQLGNDRTTPSEIFRVSYPEFSSSVNFIEFPEENYLKFPIGERFGYVDVDETMLGQLGYTVSDVEEELTNNNQIKIYIKDKLKMIDWLKSMTTYEEKTTNVFIISKETTGMDGNLIPEVLLDLN